MRRRRKGGGVRARYLTELERMERLYGGPKFGYPFAAQITALKAGEPVIVTHGYEIDLPPDSGPFCLEPDGAITPVTDVLDPIAAMPTVIGHRRPDGSLVRSKP